MSCELRSRQGITVVELMVSLTVIAMLLGLLLPAIQSARESSRRLHCANNLRGLAGGLIHFEQTYKCFPPASVTGMFPNGARLERRNWVVDLLPFIGQRPLADRWDKEASRTAASNLTIAQTHISALVCPSDISVVYRGDLSYALNGGIGVWARDRGKGCDAVAGADNVFIDLNGDGIFCHPIEDRPPDLALHAKLALFFPASENAELFRATVPIRHYSIGQVSDGASNTFLISENVRTGADPEIASRNWSNTDPRTTLFHFNPSICREHSCRPDGTMLFLANDADAAINAGRLKPEGSSPYASSFHPYGVNVGLADGSIRFISEDVSGLVYYNLFSPQGGDLNASALDGGVASNSF